MKVSVLMLAYNHRKFIERAIDSVLDQETTFPYELIIRDDGSSDGTPQLVSRYQAEHPAMVRVLPTERRLGMMQNLREVYRACEGEYISPLDGDDFWSCPLRLQRTVDFLDSHPQCSMCFHNALVIDEDGNYFAKSFCSPEQKEISGLVDILVENFIPTSAGLYRHARFLQGFMPTYGDLLIADWPVNISYARLGLIGYLPQTMSVYTKHAAGQWTGASYDDKIRSILGMYAAVDKLTNRRYASLLDALGAYWKNRFELENLYRQRQQAREEQLRSAEPAKQQAKERIVRFDERILACRSDQESLQRLVDQLHHEAADSSPASAVSSNDVVPGHTETKP